MDLSKYMALFTREARERLTRAEAALGSQGAAGLQRAVGEFHAVKGAASSLGLDDYAAVAAEAENEGRSALAWPSEAQAEAARHLLEKARRLLAAVDDPQRMRS